MSFSKPIFIIDDDRRDREMLERALRHVMPEARFRSFAVLEDSYGPILQDKPQCIILDDYLSHMNALDTLPFMKRMSMDGRIIIVASSLVRGRKEVLTAAGCADYLAKPDIASDPQILSDAIHALALKRKAAAERKQQQPSLFDRFPELQNLPPLEPRDRRRSV
ncbi:MAG: response regulator [Pseudomonadota bacterium]